MARIFSAALIGAVALVVQAQSPRDTPSPTTGTGSISGRVVSAETGDPVRKTRVTVEAADAPRVTPVFSDAEGRFAIEGLSPARYIVTAAKPGFIRTKSARVDVTAGAQVGGMELRMPRSASISGRVVDENGEPLVMANVSAETTDGRITREVAATLTNDLGEYRLGNLTAGSVLVGVKAIGDYASTVGVPPVNPDGGFRFGGMTINASGSSFAFDLYSDQIPRFYYPGAVTRDRAQPITIAAGEEKLAIDFTVVPARPRLLPTGGRVEATDRSTLGRIGGRVVAADGRPLSRAHVRLTRTPTAGPPRIATTLDDGTYEFSNVPPGDYFVGAMRFGYLAQQFGQRSQVRRRETLHLAGGGTLEHVDITLPRYGVIAGRVLDENGDPLERARVRVLKVRSVLGRPRLVDAPGINPALTDDLGSYRIFNVAPGAYVVGAEIGAVMTADVPGYATTYFAGTAEPSFAQGVTVDVAQQISGIDIPLQQVRTARISGRIYDSKSEPWSGAVSLDVSERSGSPLAAVSMGARLDPGGVFEFPNVAPGDYVMRARRPYGSNPHTEGEFASQFITVTGTDIEGLIVHASEGSTISGHVTLDGMGSPRRDAIEFSAIPFDPDVSPFGMGNFARAEIRDDWTFELNGISGPRRFRLANAPDGWALKSVLAHGIDVTDVILPFGTKQQSIGDLEVVLTDRITRLVGTVADGRGRTVSDYRCAIFAADRDKWYPASRFVDIVSPKADGTLDVQGLPAGEYFAAAVDAGSEDPDHDSWTDPASLEALTSRATRVMLTEGLTASVNIRLSDR